MAKTILGCSKADFMLDPRTPEGEIYYAENPNLLYLIRQSYGGKYPNNGEGSGDTPWTTMPNCVAYAWARCMEIWVPLIEQCANYHDQTYYDIFNNMQPFYDGLDYLRKVYDVDRLAQGNGEDTVDRLYKTSDLKSLGNWAAGVKYFHLDYIMPWYVPSDQFAHGLETLSRRGVYPPKPTTLDIYAQGVSQYGVEDYKQLQNTKASQYSNITETAELRAAGAVVTASLLHPALLNNLMWNSLLNFSLPTGSIMVYGSGNLGQGRAGHVMVVEDGSSVTETDLGTQLFPTISDANIPHNSWGRTVKYYDWTKYAGSVDRDKYNHVYRDEAEDFLVGIILPPMEIIQQLLASASKHRTRFGKTNFQSAKTLRRIHSGIQDYSPEQ